MAYAIFIALVVFWSTGALAAFVYLRQERTGGPARELAAISLRLLAPAALFGALSLALLLPNLSELLFGGAPHHPAEVGLSLHGADGSFAGLVVLALIAALMLWAWLPPLLSWLRSSLLTRRLIGVARRRRLGELLPEGVAGIPAEREVLVVPGAWIGLVGVVRPVLLVGEDLLGMLQPRELAAALAHEEAHRRGGHAWRRLLLLVISRWLPSLGRRLHARWRRVSEQLCDLEAARVVGGPAWVASALLAVHRLQRADRSRAEQQLRGISTALGFVSAGGLAQRVEQLLEVPASAAAVESLDSATVRTRWLLLGAVVTLVAFHGPIHHAVEGILRSIP